MYKVTLSMPIYNVAPYVERALLSALNQTFESIEFLLVDDRGTVIVWILSVESSRNIQGERMFVL